MSRMFLYFDKPRQPTGNETATYPIYELDLQGLADAGMVSWTLGGQVTNAVNECYHVSGSVNNANVNQYLSTNIPHQQWQDGSILQARISKYVLNENNVYVPDPEYYDFEEIPIGQQPEDWGTASNYLRYVVSSNATIDGQTVTYRAYYNIRKVATWRSYNQYVRDKNRSIIRHFYTENGYSFGVYQGADCDGVSGSSLGPVFNVAGDSQYSDNFSNPDPSYYTWCNPSENSLRVGGNSVRVLSPWWSRSDTAEDKGKMIAGREVSAATFFIFVHGVYNDKDYYGVLCIYPQDFSETATFKQIAFSLFTAEFWGNSIIAGGGGESVWGNDGPTSVPQGGNGSWIAHSDNRGDPNGDGTLNIASNWGAQSSIASTGYNKYHILVSGQLDYTPAFEEMCASLWNPDTWTGFKNLYFSPLSSIIVCHQMPASLCPQLPAVPTLKKIEAATVELTTHQVPIFNDLIHHYHVGSINITDYTDAFADFDNTSIYIHLPYIGTYQIDTKAVMEGELSVDYISDVMTGDITAFIWTKDFNNNYTYRYTFKGNCAKEIPLSQRVPFSTQVVNKAASIIPSAIGYAIGGGIGALVGGSTALSAVSEVGTETFSNPESFKKAFVSHNAKIGAKSGAAIGISVGRNAASALHAGTQTVASNSEGGTVSSPIDTQCYLIIERPIWSAPENYRKLFGYPSDIGGTINEKFEGFLSVRSIKLDDITAATDAEKAEIYQLMATGVYVSDDFGPED